MKVRAKLTAVLVAAGMLLPAGCGGGYYCPDVEVTRAQMAVFLLKAEHGAAYQAYRERVPMLVPGRRCDSGWTWTCGPT